MATTYDEEAPSITTLDIAFIAVYFILVVAVGFWSMFRANRGTISGYFLAGRFMTWLPVGASLFASNIGSEHFVGLAGSGAAGGIGVGAFELNALIILQLLGWVFLPVYIASAVHTLPVYMSKRFGRQRIRVYLAVLSLLLYVLTKISVNMYSGALFVRESLKWSTYPAVLLILALTAVCTVTGGLAAVIYMDTFQCFLMMGGAVGLAIYSLIEVGGWSSLVEQYMVAVPNGTDLATATCNVPSPKAFTMLREASDPDFPWPGFLFGQSPASIWYWAADQMIVQRALASKSLSHAQGATLFAGLLKILPLFVIVVPGMISRVLFKEVVGCIDDCEARCGNPVSCTNVAYPRLVVHLLPSGLRGIMLAGMMAALMSDLTSIFNSSATLFTLDIWQRVRRQASAREMLIVGRSAAPPSARLVDERLRVWVLVMVGVAIAWLPAVGRQQGGQLFIYIQVISADLAPPIAAVYLLAVLWKRTNETGAFWGLMSGFAVGVVRMVGEFVFTSPACGEADERPALIADLQYMYFALALFWLSVGVTVVVSLLTAPPEPFRLIRTTYWTRKDQTKRDDDELFEVDHEAEVIAREGVVTPAPQELEEETSPARQRRSALEYLRSGYDWFCGYDYTPSAAMKLADFEQHLRRITTLEQTRAEKLVLAVGLVLILGIAVFLYLFFSIVTPIQTTS